MAVLVNNYKELIKNFEEKITLVAVSKTKPVSDILELYNLGQRDFGENYVQELTEKAAQLPKDIRWHFIGHLQSNKVKFITSFIHLIHGVDSFKLLKEINKQAVKNNKVIDCLLQVHIAQEETKFGFDENELNDLFNNLTVESLNNIRVQGLMGMASFTNDLDKVRGEFKQLKNIFDKLRTHDSGLTTLSMGMSSDYKIAIEEGSNMVRIGSLIFGGRE
jgi:pyridoxal phosphate enzyme (YggS family)